MFLEGIFLFIATSTLILIELGKPAKLLVLFGLLIRKVTKNLHEENID